MAGFVYIVRAGKAFKIGVYGSAVEKRIRSLQTANHEKIETVAVIQFDRPYDLEFWLHKKYSRQNIHREWFRLDSRDINFLKKLESGDVHELCGIDYLQRKREAVKVLEKKNNHPNAEIDPTLVNNLRAIIGEDGYRVAVATNFTGVLRPKEAAAFIGVSLRELDRLFHEGKFSRSEFTPRMIRYRIKDLQAYMLLAPTSA